MAAPGRHGGQAGRAHRAGPGGATPRDPPEEGRGRAAARRAAAALPGLGSGQPARRPRARRRPPGLPAHPGHGGPRLGPLQPRPAHRDAVRRPDHGRAREQRRAYLPARRREAGAPGDRLGRRALAAAGVLPGRGAARAAGDPGGRERRIRRGHRDGGDPLARPRPGRRHPHLGRGDRVHRAARARRRDPAQRPPAGVLVHRLRVGRGELRGRPGRGGAVHAGRLGGGPRPAAGDRGPARARGAREAAAVCAPGPVDRPGQGAPAASAQGTAPGRRCLMSSGYQRYPHIHGDLITFVAGPEVWLAPAEGGRAWRLSAEDAPVSYPRFSHDGSRIAWTSWRDGNPEVYAADPDGGDATRLTYWGDPQTRVTGWTAGGEVLAISAAGQPALKYRRAFAVPGLAAYGAPPRLLPYRSE